MESAFVFNERRRSIFGKLLDFFDELRTLEPGKFLVWIDGSFTTLKKNPRDVDCVLFLDLGFYEIQDGKLSILRKSCAPLLDIYFVKVYPENDPARFLFESET